MPSLFPSLRGRARGEAFNKMNRTQLWWYSVAGKTHPLASFGQNVNFKKVYALSFLYGQKHQKEVDLGEGHCP